MQNSKLGLETFKNVIQLRNLEITIIDYMIDIQHEELKQYIGAGEECQKIFNSIFCAYEIVRGQWLFQFKLITLLDLSQGPSSLRLASSCSSILFVFQCNFFAMENEKVSNFSFLN